MPNATTAPAPIFEKPMTVDLSSITTPTR
jgi:hypothetical protein